MKSWPVVTWRLPEWVAPWVKQRLESAGAEAPGGEPLRSRAERMHFVIDLALENIRQGTGGPFAAAVFGADGGLLAPGVNQVTGIGCSSAHAEMVALALAQARVGHYDLSRQGAAELVTSTEPCAMCLGAIPWSGVSSVVSGATADDAEAVGFYEGCKPEPWTRALTSRGIEVHAGVERERSTTVFDAYRRAGGVIYNSGSSAEPPSGGDGVT